MKNIPFRKKLKIFLITVDEPFYIPIFLKVFLKEFNDITVGAAVLSPMPRKMSFWEYVYAHYRFYGTLFFAIQGVRYIFKRTLDLIHKTVKICSPHSAQSYLVEYNIPVFNIKNVNNRKFLQELNCLDIDLIISIASSQIFRKRLLDLPNLGCINVHGSLLPNYQGVNPSFWALLGGERETGVTVHFMNEKIDRGRIILQRKFVISDVETLDSLSKKVAIEGAKAVSDAICKISYGLERNLLPPQLEEGSYYSFPKAEDGRNFRAKGLRFL